MNLKDLSLSNWFIKYINILFKFFITYFNKIQLFIVKLFKPNLKVGLTIAPKIDVSETNIEYIVEVDLPGVRESDLNIIITKNGVLKIKAQRENSIDFPQRNYHRIERTYGTFERFITLPENGNFDKLDTSFVNNVLTIKISKKSSEADLLEHQHEH